ncbi:hypothetical protein M422DRAFT_252139 [Sphaerobolus stellatus SS14]|uniref:JmjC domain-containing protein n=1 Tax=Sphaerobolus stellatus (strain SS14) TaxID=990650 RepID=A0A0C9VC41_SPHS4|nr:hypothetical protein M422DRAFT_252139 [Sphaerobolus stellatus SS14]
MIPPFWQRLSLDSLAGQLITGPGFPHDDMRWNLCATAPALTRPHYDTAKLATWVHTLRGAKLWFVMDGEVPEDGMCNLDVTKHTFKYVLVEPGAVLTMKPGTPHAVFNITDCLAEGGHGLLLSALESSFHIGLREHTKGNEDTNTAHVGTENILHSLTAHYYLEILALYPKTLSQQEPNNEEESPDEPKEEEYEEATEKTVSSIIYHAELQAKITRCPSPMQFACLLCMAAHALAFEPVPVEEEDGTVHQYECPEAIYDMRKISHMRAEKLLACVPALWQPMQDCEERIRNSLKGTALQDEFQPLALDLPEPMELDSDL